MFPLLSNWLKRHDFISRLFKTGADNLQTISLPRKDAAYDVSPTQ